MRIKGRKIKGTDVIAKPLIVYGKDTINSPVLSHLRLPRGGRYDSELRWCCQRFSNNSTIPAFTDEELLTIYLYVMIEEEKYKIKSIWRYAEKHLRSWFPTLPSYQAFNVRLNRLADSLPLLVKHFLAILEQDISTPKIGLMGSYPIILCSSKRKAKVAP
ncbi:MAG: hypothetical protein AAF632_03030 [Bacteroidota bacterium]